MLKSIPTILYGTAWKEERTQKLTELALTSGFRGIDTANQRKHYFEAAVGEGIQNYLRSSGQSRDSLFIQTKFTYVRGQDHRLPYDPKAPLRTQVRQSFQSSCEHLQISSIDSYVLHGPFRHDVLSPEDLEVWSEMEGLVKDGCVQALGVSNVNLDQLKALHVAATIKPSYVQNRCFAELGWDRDIREFCQKNSIKYQAFSLLTANIDFIKSPLIVSISQRMQCTLPQLIFQFAHQIGMIPLTGTSNATHMKEDLASFRIELTPDDIRTIENVAL